MDNTEFAILFGMLFALLCQSLWQARADRKNPKTIKDNYEVLCKAINVNFSALRQILMQLVPESDRNKHQQIMDLNAALRKRLESVDLNLSLERAMVELRRAYLDTLNEHSDIWHLERPEYEIIVKEGKPPGAIDYTFIAKNHLAAEILNNLGIEHIGVTGETGKDGVSL